MTDIDYTKPDHIGIAAGGERVNGEWVPNGRYVVTAEFYPPKSDNGHYRVLADCDTLEVAQIALRGLKKWRDL